MQIKENRRACTKYYHKPQLYILPKVQPPSLSLSLVFLYENLTKRRSVNLFQLSKRNQPKKKKKKSLSLSELQYPPPPQAAMPAVAPLTSSPRLLVKPSPQTNLLPPAGIAAAACGFWYLFFFNFFFLLNIQTDPKKNRICFKSLLPSLFY